MISKLKMDGRNYDEALWFIFQIVSREHIVQMQVVLPTTDYIQCIRDILKKGDEKDEIDNNDENDTINFEFRNLLENNIDTYSMVQEVDGDNSREFKNFLAKNNIETKEALVTFISENTSHTQFNTTKIVRRLDEFFNFDEKRKNIEPAIMMLTDII